MSKTKNFKFKIDDEVTLEANGAVGCVLECREIDGENSYLVNFNVVSEKKQEGRRKRGLKPRTKTLWFQEKYLSK